jgi:hypothetical protein
MILTRVAIFSLLSGCSAIGSQHYGKLHPIGERLATTCAVVTSFDEGLRSSPQLHGPDFYVGYIDLGKYGRDPVYLIAPVDVKPDSSAGSLLKAADPNHSAFWDMAELRSGNPANGEPFEATVPAKRRETSPNSFIVYRDPIMLKAQIHKACGRMYLVAVQTNTESSPPDFVWTRLEKAHRSFMSNIAWP